MKQSVTTSKKSLRKKIEIYIDTRPHNFFSQENEAGRIYRAFQRPNSYEIWLEKEEEEKPVWLKKFIQSGRSFTEIDVIATILQEKAKNPISTFIIFEVLSGRPILEISRKLNLSRVSIYKMVSKKQILQAKELKEKMMGWEIENMRKDPNSTLESIRRKLKISQYILRKFLR